MEGEEGYHTLVGGFTKLAASNLPATVKLTTAEAAKILVAAGNRGRGRISVASTPARVQYAAHKAASKHCGPSLWYTTQPTKLSVRQNVTTTRQARTTKMAGQPQGRRENSSTPNNAFFHQKTTKQQRPAQTLRFKYTEGARHPLAQPPDFIDHTQKSTPVFHSRLSPPCRPQPRCGRTLPCRAWRWP